MVCFYLGRIKSLNSTSSHNRPTDLSAMASASNEYSLNDFSNEKAVVITSLSRHVLQVIGFTKLQPILLFIPAFAVNENSCDKILCK